VTELQGNTPADGGYARLFRRIKAEGFSAVETPVWMIADKASFCAALKEVGLDYVAMVNTCTPAGDHNGSHKLADHLASFERQVAEALSLPHGVRPLLVNSHSGQDAWPAETARAFFARALAVEKERGILICHETHRGRVLYNPWVTRDLCREFAELKLTADFSHFCVVAERVFAPDDEDWAACMKEFARATRHVHMRVGFAEGPQVNHPRAPEHKEALERHESWWDAILAAQAVAGVGSMTCEPEHGTSGYQNTLQVFAAFQSRHRPAPTSDASVRRQAQHTRPYPYPAQPFLVRRDGGSLGGELLAAAPRGRAHGEAALLARVDEGVRRGGKLFAHGYDFRVILSCFPHAPQPLF